MKCLNCGDANIDTSRFCENCGNPLRSELPQPQLVAPQTSNGHQSCPVCGIGDLDASGSCGECGRISRVQVNDCELQVLAPHLASATHRGRTHRENQDAVGFAELADGFAFVVSDGVSSSVGARQAADAAVRVVLEVLKNVDGSGQTPSQKLQLALDRAHEAICAIPYTASADLAEPQATVVAALASADIVHFAWVGDSRLYLVGAGAPSQLLTRDDSWLNELREQGVQVDQAAKDKNAHAITQCLGMRDAPPQTHLSQANLTPGHLVMLCSDGLWNYIEDGKVPGEGLELQQRCQTLVDFANAKGGHDNISVVLFDPSTHQRGHDLDEFRGAC